MNEQDRTDLLHQTIKELNAEIEQLEANKVDQDDSGPKLLLKVLVFTFAVLLGAKYFLL